jgi:hypothetical protein
MVGKDTIAMEQLPTMLIYTEKDARSKANKDKRQEVAC